METNQNLLSTDLNIDSIAELHLRETAKWARFLGIIGFIMAILLAILAFVIPSVFSRMGEVGGAGMSMVSSMGGMLTFFYLIIAGIMFMVSYFVHKFGTATGIALAQNDQAGLNEGLLNLKRLFRFYGIVVLIYLGFLALAMIVGILGSLFR